MMHHQDTGTTIGMSSIKKRRLKLKLTSHPDLHVGDCVPFYFCPRSVMLYVIHMANHAELTYRGGQESIVHLEAGLHEAVAWANEFSSSVYSRVAEAVGCGTHRPRVMTKKDWYY